MHGPPINVHLRLQTTTDPFWWSSETTCEGADACEVAEWAVFFDGPDPHTDEFGSPMNIPYWAAGNDGLGRARDVQVSSGRTGNATHDELTCPR